MYSATVSRRSISSTCGRGSAGLLRVCARADDGAAAIELLLRDWMKETQSQPFFWFVNLVECHSPYLPPRPYNDVSLGARIKAARDVQRYQTVGAVWRACAVREPLSSTALSRMRHLYGRSIRQMDDWLGRLLEQMDGHGLLDDTLVIVTSDHGENLGEGNMIGHAFSLDERLVHIPLIVSGPGAFSTDAALSLTSIPALIAKAIGLTDFPWENGSDGIAVAQYDALTAPDDPRVAKVATEWHLDETAIARITARGTAVTDGTMKLVREAGTESLYEIEADPLETRPLDPTSAPASLRATLDRADAEASVVRPGGDEVRSETTDQDENAELERRLKLLGYL